MTFLMLGLRMVLVVWRHSVNFIFWDQWDFYTPLFAHASLWRIFSWQHGPHREGIGLILDKLVLDRTHWSNRAESLLIVAAIVSAATVAVRLKVRLFGKLDYTDLFIPCLFLTLAQIDQLIGVANPSYSAFPELLIMLYCLAWTIGNGPARYSAILVLNFLLLYTGFGFFMGVVTLVLVALDIRRTIRASSRGAALPVTALGLALISFASFFYHYRWMPAISCFVFPDPHPFNYPWFLSLELSLFIGMRRSVVLASVFGAGLTLVIIALLLWHGIRLCRATSWNNLDVTIVALLGFTLLFGLNAAIGRVCLGMPAAGQTSRYMGLLVPAFLAMYLHLLSWRDHTKKAVAVTLFAVIVLPNTLKMHRDPIQENGKRAWKACYLRVEDIDYCNQITGYPPHWDASATHLKEKLDYLKCNRLNLFSSPSGS
ncbi:MAG TPA: hypothetical protein VEK33_21670 [Terriglobales bacterium]|nr:hypothetical protein [Terriglobales bacterium]